MKKAITLIAISLTIVSSLFASQLGNININDSALLALYGVSAGYTPPTIAIGPYDAAFGIDMKSTQYPSRVGQTEINFEQGDTPDNANKKDYYDDQMVALASIYDIPVAYKVSGSGNTIQVAVLENLPSFRISTDSNSDFAFVSQSRPTYRRPMELSMQSRVSSENSGYGGTENSTFIIFGEGQNNDRTFTIERDNYNRNISTWFDVVLGLPYTSYTDTGVIIGNTPYELTEANDYTAIITITIQYVPATYKIYNVTREWRWAWSSYEISYVKDTENTVTPGTAITSTLTIPFSGYYSKAASGATADTSASLYVNTLPHAASISLNRDAGTFIDVAYIDLLYNYPTTYIKGSDTSTYYQYTWGETYETVSVDSCSNGENNARIFLSANRDPKVSNTLGFMFVKEGETIIEEGVNAVPYQVRVTNNRTNRTMFFDGSECIGADYKMVGEDKFLYSSHHFGNPFNHTEGALKQIDENGNVVQQEVKYWYGTRWEDVVLIDSATRVAHYHTFNGTVSILIDDTAMLEAGLYESSIYVHLIAP